INHSTAGDTVRVTPGVYYENVVMKDGVDLIGADPTTTIIDAGGYGSVVEASANATLSGFTIRNGTGSKLWWYPAHIPYRMGGGVRCVYKNTTIENNIIEANYRIPDTYLTGGGVFLYYCTATVRNNVIVGNHASAGSGLWITSGSPRILNNTFVDNSSHLAQSTLQAVYTSAAVENNIFYGNSSGEIRIIVLPSSSPPTISYNNFRNNQITWAPHERGDNFVVADPMFVDASGGDYHLTMESPCIDTGNPLYIDPDGTRSDIGAFYFEQFMKPDYVLTSKKANRSSEVSLSRASDRAKEHANENAAFNRTEDADYIKVAEADAVLDTDGVLVLDRAVKLEPGDYGSGLPETIYLAVIFEEYYPIVWVSEDRKSVQISDWNHPESFPEELFETLTDTELPFFAIEFYHAKEG
ncbi:MAG: nitrous oxide reductase family maturation protein NosD, partial [Candidatus Binatia bacterium]